MNKIFFFLFVVQNIFAQSITISQDINVRNDNGYEILGRYKNNILLFRDKNSEYQVAAFDEQMRLTWEHDLEFPEKKVEVLDAVGGADYFAVLYKGREKGNTLTKIHRFDANAKFVDSLLIKNWGARFLAPSITCVFSEDKKVALLYSIVQNEKIEAVAFDIENMKVLWQQDVTLNAQVRNNDGFKQAILDNLGNAFYIFEQDEAASIFGNNKHEYVIFEAGKNAVKNYKIPIVNHATYDIRFDYDNLNQQLCAVGLFSELSKSRPSGCFFMKMKSGQPQFFFDTFDDETASAIAGKKVTNNKGIADLRPLEIAFRKDGGAVVFLEEYRQFSHASGGLSSRNFTPDAGGRFVVDYYCDNVICVSYNPDGTVQWRKILPKKQFSQDDNAVFSSFGVIKTPRELRVLFNDDVRDETTTSEYIMKGDGSIERHSMFNTTNQNVQLRFKDALQLASDEVVVPSEYRSKLRLVRLRY